MQNTACFGGSAPRCSWLRISLSAGRCCGKRLRNILHGQIFDENFLMTIASVGAICIGEVEEATAVMLFYQLGELFEDMAVRKSRGSLKELMALCPDVAHVMEDGSVTDYYPVRYRWTA